MPRLSLADDGVLSGLIGTALYIGLVAVLGVAVGVLLRSSAGGIALLAGVLLILPSLVLLLPDSWADTITPYLPSEAVNSDSFGPWSALGVLACWVAVALAAAAYRLAENDA